MWVSGPLTLEGSAGYLRFPACPTMIAALLCALRERTPTGCTAQVPSLWVQPMGSGRKRYKGKKREDTVSLVPLSPRSTSPSLPATVSLYSHSCCQAPSPFHSCSSLWVPVGSSCPFPSRGGKSLHRSVARP